MLRSMPSLRSGTACVPIMLAETLHRHSIVARSRPNRRAALLLAHWPTGSCRVGVHGQTGLGHDVASPARPGLRPTGRLRRSSFLNVSHRELL